MTLMKKRTLWVMIGIALLVLLSACSNGRPAATPAPSESASEPPATVIPSPEPTPTETPKPVVTTLKLKAVGDVLIHNSLYEDAQTGDTYDFRPMFSKVMEHMADADITFANQESMVGGAEIGLSSYPSFNSPYEVADVLKEAGVDIVSMANNHTLDRGERAIQNAIAYWNEIGIAYTGSYKDAEDAQEIRVIERDGVKVSFLAFTYGTNGIPVPKGRDYLVQLIDRDRIQEDIKRAKTISDVVVLSLHFGNEYERLPNEEQKSLVKFAVDEGADIILGHHPHVLQPVEWVEREDGSRAFVIYSLGNFVSGQNKPHTQYGGVVELDIEITEFEGKKTLRLLNPGFLATYVKFENWRNYEIIPFDQLTDKDLPNAQKIDGEIEAHMKQLMPELRWVRTQ